jgi:hypothetical protein
MAFPTVLVMKTHKRGRKPLRGKSPEPLTTVTSFLTPPRKPPHFPMTLTEGREKNPKYPPRKNPVLEESSGFRKYEHRMCGREALLILPSAEANWTKETLPYRSVFVDKTTLAVLSCGYPKFFNKGEKPSLYADPRLHSDWSIQNKIDGSLVICDYIDGHFSMRTRGSPSHLTQPNASDFELLPKKHPEIVDFLRKNKNLSVLLEIETPQNVIVLRPKEVTFTLLDAVNKANFELLKKEDLYSALPHVPHPKTHPITDLESLEKNVKNWVGLEGIVLSYNNNQNRIKLKSDWYRKIHALKSGLNSLDNLADYYLQKGLPSSQELFELLEKESDFETAQDLLPLQETVSKAGELTKSKIQELRAFAQELQNLSRKDQAAAILQNKKEYSSLLFPLLEDPLNKPLDKKQVQKLLERFLHA